MKNISIIPVALFWVLICLIASLLGGCATALTPSQAILAGAITGAVTTATVAVNAEKENTKQLETIMENRKW